MREMVSGADFAGSAILFGGVLGIIVVFGYDMLALFTASLTGLDCGGSAVGM